MKIYINSTVEVDKDDVIEAMTWDVAKEVIKSFDHKREDILEILNLDDADLLDMVSARSINQHIKDNINYYDETQRMQQEIISLQAEIEKIRAPQSQISVPDNHEKAKDFFCDLFDLSHHASTDEIINHVFNAINDKKEQYDDYEKKIIDEYISKHDYFF